MLKYSLKPKGKKSARVYGSGLDISTKKAGVLCKAISRKQVAKAKGLLENLLMQRQSLDGKYYTNPAKEILNLLESAEKNAEFKGLDTEKLMVFASAHKSLVYFRPRRFRLRRQRKRLTNLQIVLVEK
jgi:large subunit ribosomal protein L22